MDDKKLPNKNDDVQNSGADFIDEEYLSSLEDISEEILRQDFDLSQLINKYLPDGFESDKASEGVSDAVDGAEEFSVEAVEAELVASEIYADLLADNESVPVENTDEAVSDGEEFDGEAMEEEHYSTDIPDEAEGEEDEVSGYYTDDVAELEDVASEDSDEESDASSIDYVDYEDSEEDIVVEGEIDSTDINLMLAFGLEDELERTMGADAAKKLTEELDQEQRARDEKSRRTVDNEYMNRTQTAEIASAYKRKYSGLKIKLTLSVILTVILFFYENLSLFGYTFDGAFNPAIYPVVYIMGSLQIMLLCAACAYRELLSGAKELFTGKQGAHSLAFVMVLGGIVYSSVLCNAVVSPKAPVLFNLAPALGCVFVLVYEFFCTKREIFAFNVVSSKRPKYVVTKLSSSYDEGDVLKFDMADFIENFFTRTKEATKASKAYAASSIIISSVAAVLCGVFSKVSGTDTAGVVESIAAGFFASCPISMFITMSYPFFCASRDAYDNDGAIIGETSLEEYADTTAVTFDDVGVFPSFGVKVQNVKIYNDNRIDSVLYYASSVFASARGPLTDVFDVATLEIGHSENVKIKAAGTGYLSASVDDCTVTFGTAAELISRGFDIPEDITDEDNEIPENISVMYMFCEENLMSKMLIRYTMDADFEFIMESLCNDGISIKIKTYDPNIDDSMIAVHVGKGKYSFSVSRYEGADEGTVVKEREDSGIVSRSTTKSLLQMLSDCAKVISARRVGITVGVVSSIISVGLVILLLIAQPEQLSSRLILIYQLFWLIPSFVTARMYVR